MENMGDAHETCEELLWLVWYFASYGGRMPLDFADGVVKQVLNDKFYPMCRGEIAKDDMFRAVQERMEK